ncbi:uncharacterized protein [Venturia canescens]|uniref:uncharacterized protein isoform X3 n=1 Tax=Venturia canescens TaxID=32260 RepID=UPI001C9CAF61|nr:uncharacterized protein LOC122417630 isoform X3 [Venturia canescens]
MEISKGLQLEIQSVQSKLKNAIRDHQICVGKLKDDPNNPDILDRIQEIQLHIVSLGRCQKQVVQRLRKEVDDFKAANANDVKVSVAALLGLNNNNHITANNESRNDDISGVRVASNGLDNVRLATAKEDYEDIVRNGDVTSRCNKSPKKGRSVSVETLSGDDEASTEHEQRDNKRQMSEEPRVERRIECSEQLSFLKVLGLITTHKSTELQNRRAERKRRSTANPQFVYSNWDVPTKKKRHSYLQSAGNVPQTRQTTARLNGPSPPPISNKPGNLVVPPKSTSPPTRASSKSLIPTQKATTRPNILRNMSESRVFPNKAITAKTENENESVALTCTATKTSQSTTSSKTVHIPGLPSGLTIERIENDSAVCINCRNPGILTNCVNCEANYHVSCHSISPPPPRLCPKCASKLIEPTAVIKKNDELVEKEREVYEHRERNSDLRLQVYELEKRSQLLGQSLQLQHRTRQELLGKQEKTQRSIKRLVDFIKLVQIRGIKSSGQVVASTSYQARPSSSRSCQSPSPRQYRSPSPGGTSPASTTRGSTTSSPITISNEETTHQTLLTRQQSSLTITRQDRASPTCHKQTRTASPPIPTNCRSSTSPKLYTKLPRNQKSKSSSENEEKMKLAQTTTNSDIKTEKKMEQGWECATREKRGSGSRSGVQVGSRSSPEVSGSRVSPGVGRSRRREQCPDSLESCSQVRRSESQSHLSTGTTTTWMNYKNARTTADLQDYASSRSSGTVDELTELRTSAERGTIPRMEMEKSKSGESVKLKIKQRVSSTVAGAYTVQNLVNSTHCSQAITSPISSALITKHQDSPKEAIRSENSETINCHSPRAQSPAAPSLSNSSHQPNT